MDLTFGPLILGAIFSIIHSSDGGVDDFATTALIAAAQERNKQDPSFDFPAVIITNADCEPLSALAAGLKTAQFLNMQTQVGLSSSRVWNQFPWQWRLDSNAVNQIPCLQGQSVGHDFLSLPEGNRLLVDNLIKADEVKIIATGPLTTIADVFKSHPELIEKVSELHWMGGALDIAGNIMDSPEIPRELLNEKAEWNVFCDPEAADWVFKNTSFDIYLYPLDISDKTIPNHFMKILNQKKSTVHSRYVAECYKIVENVEQYRMWDVVAAAGILFPEVLKLPVKEKLRVDVSFKEQGALTRDERGREVFVYKEFKDDDPSRFYEAVADLLTDSSYSQNQEIIEITEQWLSSIAEPQEQSPNAFAWFTHIPHSRFNGVLRFSYESDREEKLDSLLAKAATDLPITFWIDPKNSPQELIDALKARHFVSAGHFPTMTWRVQPTDAPLLEVRPADMKLYHEIVAASFHYSEEVKREYARLLGEKEGEHYLVYLDGKPVGTGTLYFKGKAGAVFHVATLPEYQRLGAARSMMQFLMNRAYAIGLEKLVFISSHVGEKLYTSLGFQKADEIEIYIRQ